MTNKDRYSEKHGVTKAADRFRISRNTIYEWKAKYEGNWKSLLDRSHRPHHHPAEQKQEEYDLILGLVWKIKVAHLDEIM